MSGLWLPVSSPQLRALGGELEGGRGEHGAGRRGEEDFLGISASCGPGCRTGEKAEGWAPHQNEPPQRFGANPSPITTLPSINCVYFPKHFPSWPLVSSPDTPVRWAFLFPFQRESHEEACLPAVPSTSCVTLESSLAFSGPYRPHGHNETHQRSSQGLPAQAEPAAGRDHTGSCSLSFFFHLQTPLGNLFKRQPSRVVDFL